MCMAARRANLSPRQLSFSFVQIVVEAALPGLDCAAPMRNTSSGWIACCATQLRVTTEPFARPILSREVWGRVVTFEAPEKRRKGGQTK